MESDHTVAVCRICENLTGDNISAIENELRESLLLAEYLLIYVEEVNSIDISGIIMLCSIRRKAGIHGKRVEFAGTIPRKLISQVIALGFPRNDCIQRTKHSCLWDFI